MITLCIRHTLNANKLAEFEAYARSLLRPVERCGGKFVAFYLPTKIARSTNAAFGLIDFPDLATYERYREQLASDPDNVESRRIKLDRLCEICNRFCYDSPCVTLEDLQ